MTDRFDSSLGRRALGANLLRVAALLGLRTVGGSSLLALGACAADGSAGSGEPLPPTGTGELPSDLAAPPADSDDVDVSQVPLRYVEAETVIVGSGYGGAVVAKRLAEKGKKVLMLEMGRLWNQPGPDGKVFCSTAKPDGRAMWFRDKLFLGGLMPIDLDIPIANQAGVLDVVPSPNMNVFCGRGVGGGSLVNLAMLVTPPRDVLKRAMPMVDADVMLATYYPRALRVLGGNTVRRAWWNNTPWYQYSRVGRAAAEAAGFQTEFLTSGYDYTYMEKEEAGTAPASALGVDAGFGNNYGKGSVDKNYLADAIGTGNLTIESQHIVREVRRDARGKFVVAVNAIDVAGKLVERKEIACTHLFLCGGSMGTSQLLTRARDTGTLDALSPAIGTKWGPNSDIFTMRGNQLWNPTGDKISAVPATGFRTVDQDGKAVFSMDIPFPIGIETFISFSIVMTENPEGGKFVYNPVTDQAELKWDKGQNDPAVKSARFVFDKLNAANLTSYKPEMFRGQELLDNTTYHPVGGCPMGEATDDYGRVRGYERLYIADGSLIPASIVSNPALTVAALAERNIERIMTEDYKI
jgi:cholesterol oxidase